MLCSCFVVIVVLCIFILVCTSVGLLPPSESPIAVSNNINNSNNNNNISILHHTMAKLQFSCHRIQLLPRTQQSEKFSGIILFYK